MVMMMSMTVLIRPHELPDLHSAAVVVDVTPVEAGSGFAGAFQSLKLNHCLENNKIYFGQTKTFYYLVTK